MAKCEATTVVRAAAAAFHDRYLELCRHRNVLPLTAVCKGRPHNALDLCADRVRLDEWRDVLRALAGDQGLVRVLIRLRKCAPKVLDKFDTEKKCRNLHTDPLITSRYVFAKAIHAFGALLASSAALHTFALEGMPLAGRYIETIATGLSGNKHRALRQITLARCALGDEACRTLCAALRTMPSLERVDLSGCGLGEPGASSVAELLRHQKIQRFSDAWQESLRYRDVDPDQIPGLKHVSLADNPAIGDRGLQHLLTVLAEDVWIKSVQMPNCGLTDAGGRALLECLEANTTLVVFDVRHNDAIGEGLMNRIRRQFEVEAEIAGASESNNAGPETEEGQQQLNRAIARAEDSRLGERIAFLEQQLQIESMVRLQAEQLNGQLQEQLACHQQVQQQQQEAQQQQQQQQQNGTVAVPDGYVMVPTKQLSSLFLEVDEIRGTSSSSHSQSSSLLTQISNPKFTADKLQRSDEPPNSLRKAKSETTTRNGVSNVNVHFSKVSQSECRIRQVVERRASTPRYVERTIGDSVDITMQRMQYQQLCDSDIVNKGEPENATGPMMEPIAKSHHGGVNPQSFFAPNADAESPESGGSSGCEAE